MKKKKNYTDRFDSFKGSNYDVIKADPKLKAERFKVVRHCRMCNEKLPATRYFYCADCNSSFIEPMTRGF